MKRLALLLLATLVVAASSLVGSPALAAPGQRSGIGEESLARLDVTKITPTIVSADSPPELTVSGTLTNTSERTLSDIEARVQRGNTVTSDDDAYRALRGDPAADRTTPRFSPAAPTLEPGQRTSFELRVPISGGSNSLRVHQPGVYPLLINLNGVPGSGDRARVAEGRMLLPVLSPPGTPPPAPPPRPTPATMIIPLVDYPKLRDQIPGRSAVLSDDRLAESLTPGGRLYDLLQGVEDSAPPGSPLGTGLCFAVDPDLLATVRAMQGNYDVLSPGGGTVPGTGSGAARLWLSKLKSVTEGRCVIALPHSDADLVALSRSNQPDLMRQALSGADVVQSVLGTRPRRDVVWPVDDVLDERTLSDLTGTGAKTFLMDPSGLRGQQQPGQPTRIALPPGRGGASGSGPNQSTGNSANPTALPIDPLLSSALNPLREPPEGNSAALSPPTSGALTVQDAVGALAFRATAGQRGGPTLITPPRRWNITGDDMRALLDGMRRLTEQHYIQPKSLPDPDTGSGMSGGPNSTAQSGAATSASSTLSYPVGAGTAEIPRDVLKRIGAANAHLTDLSRGMERDQALNVEPDDVVSPARTGLLRAASSAWRNDTAGAHRQMGVAAQGALDLRAGVQINEFNGQLSRAASDSPTPLTIHNNLPVTMWVHLDVRKPPDVKIKDLGSALRIPAQGSRQVFLQTSVDRPGNFVVDVQTRTPSGLALGRPARLQLESGEYGTITLVLTGTAGALLVILVGRRIYRRVRGSQSGRNGPGGETGSADPSAGTGPVVGPTDPRGGPDRPDLEDTAPISRTPIAEGPVRNGRTADERSRTEPISDRPLDDGSVRGGEQDSGSLKRPRDLKRPET